METSPAGTRSQSHVDARVLTVEAISAYLAHLTPDGVLAIIQNNAALANQTREAVLAAVSSPRQVSTVTLTGPENPFNWLILVRNSPFTTADVQQHTSNSLVHSTLPTTPGEGPIATDNRPFLFESPARQWTYAGLTALAVTTVIVLTMLRQRRSPHLNRLFVLATVLGATTFVQQMLVIAWCHAAVGLPSLATGVGVAAALTGAACGVWLRTAGYFRSLRVSIVLVGSASLLMLLLGGQIAQVALHLPVPAATACIALAFGALCLPAGLPFLALMDAAAQHKDRRAAVLVAGDSLGAVLAGSLGAALIVSAGYLALGVTALALAALALAAVAVGARFGLPQV